MTPVFKSLVLLLSFFAGCGSNGLGKVEHYWAEGATAREFNRGTVYQWFVASSMFGTDRGQPKVAEDVDRLIRELIDDGMQRRGFVLPAEKQSATYWVNYRVHQRTDQAQTGHDSWEVGVLAIELSDAKGGELVWRGWAEAKLEFNLAPEVRRRKIALAVDKILDGLVKPKR
jgi:hypothetical protein